MIVSSSFFGSIKIIELELNFRFFGFERDQMLVKVTGFVYMTTNNKFT